MALKKINTSFISDLLAEDKKVNLKLTTKDDSITPETFRRIQTIKSYGNFMTYTIPSPNTTRSFGRRTNTQDKSLSFYKNFINKLKNYDEQAIDEAISSSIDLSVTPYINSGALTTANKNMFMSNKKQLVALLVNLYAKRIELLTITKDYIYTISIDDEKMYESKINQALIENKQISDNFQKELRSLIVVCNCEHAHSLFIRTLKTRLVAFGYGWY